jgi:hypothetical protein
LTDAVRINTQGTPGTGDADVAAEDRLRWTSVPRWPAPELPPASSYLACWFGGEGQRRVEALLSAANRGIPVRTAAFAERWDADAGTRLRRLLGECLTGVRIILGGPESAVMRAAALARQFGATSEELVLVAAEAARAAEAGTGERARGERVSSEYVDGPAGRRVFCAACRQAFDAVAALEDVVTCPGCAAGLIVDHRFSRPHAAYFGWPTGLDLHR